MIPLSNAVCALTGCQQSSAWKEAGGCEDDDKNVSQAFETKEFVLAERIIVMKLMTR